MTTVIAYYESIATLFRIGLFSSITMSVLSYNLYVHIYNINYTQYYTLHIYNIHYTQYYTLDLYNIIMYSVN